MVEARNLASYLRCHRRYHDRSPKHSYRYSPQSIKRGSVLRESRDLLNRYRQRAIIEIAR